MPKESIVPTVLLASGSANPLDVSFIDEEDHKEPWKRSRQDHSVMPDNLPSSIKVTLSDRIYIEKAPLPQALLNRMIRLAAFQNPEFYKAQAMRFSVWDKPRVIGCADNFPYHIALPRGCLGPLQDLLKGISINCDIYDERFEGVPITAGFQGELKPEQKIALDAMLKHDTGILFAPTAFGKTVTAAALIAQRGVNTLILVHRTELQSQWAERLKSFLNMSPDMPGRIGGGKKLISGKIDIALAQSLSRKGSNSSLAENYGQVIVDECHHVGAVSFEAILKKAKARYVVGLTATPVRRDGQQPIIYMQCGPIRHKAAQSTGGEFSMTVVPCFREQVVSVGESDGIQDVFRQLIMDPDRTKAIAAAVNGVWAAGKKVLVLTERVEHLELILAALPPECTPCVLHGKVPKKQRTERLLELHSLPPNQPRVLLATGKLIGEGFDHSALDTLILAMPVSWKGTLQQYVGRLHRLHQGKTDVNVIDFVDLGHPALVRMWERRQKGYRAMGYTIVDANIGISDRSTTDG